LRTTGFAMVLLLHKVLSPAGVGAVVGHLPCREGFVWGER